jgi:hypothetical protein
MIVVLCVGDVLSSLLGATDGGHSRLVGTWLGTSVGSPPLSKRDGTLDGDKLGCCESWWVGPTETVELGPELGIKEGKAGGIGDGRRVGFPLDIVLGLTDGKELGSCDTTRVGLCVDDVVGTWLGTSVGSPVWSK